MYENKLTLSLVISFTFHLVVIIFMSSLLPTSKPPLKKPVWVDLVDIKNEPAAINDTRPELKELQPSNLLDEASQEDAFGKGPLLNEQMSPLAPSFDYANLMSNRKLTPYNHSLMEIEPLYPAPAYIHGDTIDDTRVDTGKLFEEYFLNLRNKVETNWTVASYADLREGTAIVQLTISADGSLAAIELSQSSGMVVHDYEAIEAVKKTAPFQPPPKELLTKKKFLIIRFSFYYIITP